MLVLNMLDDKIMQFLQLTTPSMMLTQGWPITLTTSEDQLQTRYYQVHYL